MGIDVVYIGLSWFIGTLDQDGFLHQPKIYLFTTTNHGIMSLPGDPDKIDAKKADFFYELPDGETKELYVKSVTKIVTTPDKIITLS